jgi:MFS family permease
LSVDCATTERTPGVLQGLVLLLPITLAVMGIAVLVPIVPQMMEHFSSVPGYRYLIQGGVLTMPALCVTLFSPVAGWLADRIGRRDLLITSMIAYALLGIAPLALDNLYAIIASRVGVGLCEALVMTVSTTLIGDYFKDRARERWLASQTAVASISSLALIPLGGLLGSAYGWRGPFGVYLFSLVLAVCIWLFTWEPRAPDPAANEHTGPGHAPLPWTRLGGICGITLFASVMFYTIQTQSSLALNVLGVDSPARIGVLTMMASLGVPVGTFVFRALTRLRIGVLLALEFLIIGVGFALMGKATSAPAFVAAAALNQLGCGMVLPTLLTWATRGLAFEVRGRGTGIWQATFSVGQFLSAVVITSLADSAGGLLPAFIMLGAANFLAAFLALTGQLRYRPSPAASTGKP